MEVEFLSARSDIILNATNDKVKKILLVEDDENMIDFISVILRDMLINADLICVNSFELAVENLIKNSELNEKNPFDLIITDIFLEGVGTGVDLYKIVKRVYPNIPFFVMSTLSVDSFYQAIVIEKQDNMSYIRKPFPFTICKNELKKILK